MADIESNAGDLPRPVVNKRAVFKHPTAVVESEEIGEGTRIWHFVHVREKASVGENCNIGKSVYIDTGVSIGSNVKIGNFASLFKGVIIEDDVFIGPAVTFTNDLYPRAFIWDEEKVAHTLVKKGTSIGANTTIVCGVTINEYAMIGAGSVVVKDAVPFGLYYGNPARRKGFVCYCGKKLGKVTAENEEEIQYECVCGKKVEIRRAWQK
ncbi:MAG: N-acetyltransferase [Peptococcaceae bacterium]|nr:MAG: N-acetyltransferase [Peptococcaceae bacterium]